MTTETFFQLHYHLTDTEGLFDLAQGIAVQRRRLKKHDARCRSFRWFSRRLLWQGAVVVGVVVVVFVVGGCVGVWGVFGVGGGCFRLWVAGVLFARWGLCFGCGVLELVLCALMQRNYRRGWRQFQQQNDPDGCILFDGGGIREENRKGKPTHFDWEDWDVAVVTPRVIVLTFRVPVLLFFPYTEEAAITVAHAARAFGKEDAVVYRQKI